MRYYEPESVDEVIGLLEAQPEARCLAGGATLIALMNADLLVPPALIGLRRVQALVGITDDPQGLRIGALTTHREVAAEARLAGAARVVRRAAAQIAHPAIRNVGTIGGSVSHGDPSTDLPAALVAAEARIAIVGPGGPREIEAEKFFVDYLETALGLAEIVTSVLVPPGRADANGDYLKFARVDGDYATVSVAAVIALSGLKCTHARIALGACGPRPVRTPRADACLIGTHLSYDDLVQAGALLEAAADPLDDVRGSADYRRLLIPRLVTSAVERLRAS